MLKAREERAAIQRTYLNKYSQSALICLTLNIPGPIKNVPILETVFQQLKQEIFNNIGEMSPSHSSFYNHQTGLEFYLSIPDEPIKLKKKMIAIEDTHAFGRIADIDVLYLELNNVNVVSRRQLNIQPRKCYICGDEAKVCGRIQKHSIDEIQQVISRIILHGI